MVVCNILSLPPPRRLCFTGNLSRCLFVCLCLPYKSHPKSNFRQTSPTDRPQAGKEQVRFSRLWVIGQGQRVTKIEVFWTRWLLNRRKAVNQNLHEYFYYTSSCTSYDLPHEKELERNWSIKKPKTKKQRAHDVRPVYDIPSVYNKKDLWNRWVLNLHWSAANTSLHFAVAGNKGVLP